MANFLLSVVAEGAKDALAQDAMGSFGDGLMMPDRNAQKPDVLAKLFARPEAQVTPSMVGSGTANDPNIIPQSSKPGGRGGFLDFLRGSF